MSAVLSSWWLIGGAAGVDLAAAAAVRSLRGFSRGKLDDYCRPRGNPRRLEQVLKGDEPALAALEILEGVAAVVVAVAIVARTAGRVQAIPDWRFGARIALGIGLASAVLVVVRVWAAGMIAAVFAEGLIYHAWPVLDAVRWLLRPLVAIGCGLTTAVRRLAGQAEPQAVSPFAAEILTVVSEGEREGVLQEEAREMIESVIELRDAEVSEIMTPRTIMVSVPLTATLERVRQVILETGHSRIPVYGKNQDDIVGVVYVKDLLTYLTTTAPKLVALADVLREPYFVPETKRVHELLREFKRGRVHMALVLDEYGGVAGVVTIEDILEEIVGEIADEYDEPEVERVKRLSDNLAEVDGALRIDELNDQLHLNLPEDGDYDTVGGFVFSALGRIPQNGEQFTYGNVSLTVLDVGQRKINRLRIEVEPKRQAAPQT